jgi:hypothetical protein
VLPKVFGPLMTRYDTVPHTFTSLLPCGLRDYKKKTQGPTQYADAAKMARLEMNNTPHNVSYQIAKSTIHVFQNKLSDIQSKLYDIKNLEMTDPETFESYMHTEYVEKKLPLKQLKTLQKQEYDLKKKVGQYEEVIKSVEDTIEKEIKHLNDNLGQHRELFEKNPDYAKVLEAMGYEIVNGHVQVKKWEPIEPDTSILDTPELELNEQPALVSNQPEQIPEKPDTEVKPVEQPRRKGRWTNFLSGFKWKM